MAHLQPTTTAGARALCRTDLTDLTDLPNTYEPSPHALQEPTHGSWLNLIEGFFSKLARSVLRYIRVISKHELKERLMAFIADITREPVVHTWRYKIGDVASADRHVI